MTIIRTRQCFQFRALQITHLHFPTRFTRHTALSPTLTHYPNIISTFLSLRREHLNISVLICYYQNQQNLKPRHKQQGHGHLQLTCYTSRQRSAPLALVKTNVEDRDLGYRAVVGGGRWAARSDLDRGVIAGICCHRWWRRVTGGCDWSREG